MKFTAVYVTIILHQQSLKNIMQCSNYTSRDLKSWSNQGKTFITQASPIFQLFHTSGSSPQIRKLDKHTARETLENNISESQNQDAAKRISKQAREEDEKQNTKPMLKTKPREDSEDVPYQKSEQKRIYGQRDERVCRTFSECRLRLGLSGGLEF